jgi:hypothetical protein
MEVFISWSGERSGQVATALERWLPRIVPKCEPFLSSSIQAGTPWIGKVVSKLESSHFGILCLTPDNQENPWIAFEAGVLARADEKKKEQIVCPLLVDFPVGVVPKAPLGLFQCAVLSRAGIKKLIVAISGLQDNHEATIASLTSFDDLWPHFAADLAADLAAAPLVRSSVGGARGRTKAGPESPESSLEWGS